VINGVPNCSAPSTAADAEIPALRRLRLEQHADAFHKIVEVGNVRQHIISGQQNRAVLPSARIVFCRLRSKNRNQRRNAFALCLNRNVGSGLDAEHRNAALFEIL